MGGIISYFHGESGQVEDRQWIIRGNRLTYAIRLAGNPHRQFALDYNNDIGIDPSIQPGDAVTYVRLDPKCGIWVKPVDQNYPRVDAAVSRVTENREIIKVFRAGGDWKRKVEVGVPMRRGPMEPISEEPHTSATFFVSYRHKNVLLVRQLVEDIQGGTDLDVWLDLEHPAEAPEHKEQVAQWLHQAIDQAHGFVVLLTKDAVESEWVDLEIQFARDKMQSETNFRAVLLQLADVPVPAGASGMCVIDCNGLWMSNGLNEELFAAVYQHPGRRDWAAEQRKNGYKVWDEDSVLTYGDLRSDAGSAVGLEWSIRDNDLYWELDYQRNGEPQHVSGCGAGEPIDLDIQPGDQIGFFVCRRRCGVHSDWGLPLWMRSGDLELSPDPVLDRFYQELPQDAPSKDNLRDPGGRPAILKPTSPGPPPPGFRQIRLPDPSPAIEDEICAGLEKLSPAETLPVIVKLGDLERGNRRLLRLRWWLPRLWILATIGYPIYDLVSSQPPPEWWARIVVAGAGPIVVWLGIRWWIRVNVVRQCQDRDYEWRPQGVHLGWLLGETTREERDVEFKCPHCRERAHTFTVRILRAQALFLLFNPWIWDPLRAATISYNRVIRLQLFCPHGGHPFEGSFCNRQNSYNPIVHVRAVGLGLPTP